MRRRALGVLLAAAFGASACLDPTEATVSITTDATCPLGGTSLAFGTGNIERKSPTTSTLACRDDGYIGTIVATPSGEKDSAWALRVVTSIDEDFPAESCVAPDYGPSCIVARRSLSFLPNKSLLLPVAMRVSCAGVHCPEDQTCVDGYCKSATVDPDQCAKKSGCTPLPGNVPWLVRFGASGTETVSYLAASSDDSLFLTGSYESEVDFGGGLLPSIGGADAFVLSLSPGGLHRWSRGFGGAGLDMTGGIAVGPNGSIYVLATFEASMELESGVLTSAGGSDLAVIALDRSGNIAWARSYPGAGDVSAGSLAVDQNGLIYVDGSFTDTIDFGATTLTSVGENDLFVAALDAAGEPIWAASLGGVGNDYGSAVAVDASGRVYVSASTEGGVTVNGEQLSSLGQQDGFVASFDDHGVARWAVSMGSPRNDVATDIAVRADGTVAVTGSFTGSAKVSGQVVDTVDDDGFIALLDANGKLIWARAVGAVGLDVGSRVAFSDDGGLVLTGAIAHGLEPGQTIEGTTLGAQNPFAVRFDAQGAPLWSQVFPALEYGIAGGVATASNGDLFVAGSFEKTLLAPSGDLASSGGDDLFVARVAPPP